MRIKTKNILLLVFQAVSVILLFCPGVYIEEFWLATTTGSLLLKEETPVSFVTKLTEADAGRFIGILVLLTMLILLIVFIYQFCSKKHSIAASIIACMQIVLFVIYSLGCTEEPWDIGLSVDCYSAAFLFFVILALLIAIAVIAVVSNHKIKLYGIQEELVRATNVYMPNSNADELSKYKKLLDQGVITQAEFEAKKKQLLEL